MDSSPQDLLNGSKYIAIGPGLKDLASPEHIFSKFKGEIGWNFNLFLKKNYMTFSKTLAEVHAV